MTQILLLVLVAGFVLLTIFTIFRVLRATREEDAASAQRALFIFGLGLVVAFLLVDLIA